MASSTRKKESSDLRDSLRTKIAGEGSPNPEAAAPGSTQPIEDRPVLMSDVMRTRISFGSPGIAQMAAFCRQLATLVDVGIPLLRCLNILSQRVEHPKLKRTVADVARRVEEGTSFSNALAAHPDIFSKLMVNVVRIGETGGILERSLMHLADLMERRNEIRKRMKSAVAYPTMALIVCGFVIMIILGFAMPVFRKVYESTNVPLPAITRVVLGVSDFVHAFWWLIILVIVAIVWAVRFMLRNNEGFRRGWDRMKLRLPIIGPLNVQVNVTRTARTLSNLVRAGVPLLEAIAVTAETSENLIVGEMLQKTHDNLEKGGQLEKPLREADIFPDLVVDMIAIGDEAGRLEPMFEKIADTYDSSVNLTISTMNAILEPLLIIVMGVIVMVLALAVLLPYWKIGSVVAQE